MLNPRVTGVPDGVTDDLIVWILAELVEVVRHGETEGARTGAAALLAGWRRWSN